MYFGVSAHIISSVLQSGFVQLVHAIMSFVVVGMLKSLAPLDLSNR